MAVFTKRIKTKRVETGFGTGILVQHPEIVRFAQVFSTTNERGQMEWYAQCADFYGPGAPPVTSRVPEFGGRRTLDDLEKAVADIVGMVSYED